MIKYHKSLSVYLQYPHFQIHPYIFIQYTFQLLMHMWYICIYIYIYMVQIHSHLRSPSCYVLVADLAFGTGHNWVSQAVTKVGSAQIAAWLRTSPNQRRSARVTGIRQWLVTFAGQGWVQKAIIRLWKNKKQSNRYNLPLPKRWA